MGNKVRYDGKAKHNRVIEELIQPFVRLLPICPEAAIGMGIPRPPIQLVDTQPGCSSSKIIARGRDDRAVNPTAALNHFGDSICQVHQELCGYIFQSRSPSCGVGTTPIHNLEGKQLRLGNGLVANKLLSRFPNISIVNETDLTENESIEEFLKAVKQTYQQMIANK
ncbi:MAG: DUF523 domain-containing protein [Enterobacterales bacterium]|nr:DUF523 domain-containing protein [Enterobacterales bacterium]